MDAIIGFITSGVLSLTSTGVPSTNSCRAEYAQGNADTVRAFTSATRSLTRAPPSPLCTRDNLVNTEIALERQKLAHRDLTLTQHVQANGLSTVEVGADDGVDRRGGGRVHAWLPPFPPATDDLRGQGLALA